MTRTSGIFGGGISYNKSKSKNIKIGLKFKKKKGHLLAIFCTVKYNTEDAGECFFFLFFADETVSNIAVGAECLNSKLNTQQNG